MEPGDERTDSMTTATDLAPISQIWESITQREEWTDDERADVLNELFPDDERIVPYLKRFAALMILSTTIAAFGLIGDSAAVVIGAMLVAPLMTPMLALAASLTYAQMRRFVGSLSLVVIGTVGAIATGWVVARIAGGSLTAASLSSELLARTTPSLLDLGIAVAAGLAGGYVLTHKGAGSSLPGVAIAVALVPPLATVGVALELQANDQAIGALLLYSTNLVAIVLSASVVMVVSGFVPDYIRQAARGKIGLRLLPWGNLATAFNDRPEVVSLIEFLGSAEAGKGWASRGGFTSPHPEFNPDWYANDFDRNIGEVLNQARTLRFDGSDLMIPAVGTGTFWSGMLTYVRYGNARDAAAEIQLGYASAEPFDE